MSTVVGFGGRPILAGMRFEFSASCLPIVVRSPEELGDRSKGGAEWTGRVFGPHPSVRSSRLGGIGNSIRNFQNKSQTNADGGKCSGRASLAGAASFTPPQRD